MLSKIARSCNDWYHTKIISEILKSRNLKKKKKNYIVNNKDIYFYVKTVLQALKKIKSYLIRKKKMAKVLFVLGNAGSGKTHFSRKFIKSELEQKNFWCLVDKDHVGEPITNQLMIKLGLDPDDRDSPIYKEEVRYLEYQAALSEDNECESLMLLLPCIVIGKDIQNIAIENLDFSGNLGPSAAFRLCEKK